MINNVLFISVFVFLFLLITLASLYIIIFVFVGDFKFTNIIVRESFVLTLSKKLREKRQKKITSLMNLIFKKEAQKIVELSDKKLSDSMNINIEEAKKFKKNVTIILKKSDFSFVNLSDVQEYDKINKTYNFMNIAILYIRVLSNPKNQAFIKIAIDFLNDNIDQKSLEKEIYQIYRDDKYAKSKLKEWKRKNHSKPNINDLLVRVFKDFLFKNSNIDLKLLYKKVEMA